MKVQNRPACTIHRPRYYPSDVFLFGRDLVSWDPLATWSRSLGPRLDVVEYDQEFKVTVEVPGLKRRDIYLTVSEERLTVRGKRREEKKRRDSNRYREYAFCRSITLPVPVDAKCAEAWLGDGVLRARKYISSRRRQPAGNRKSGKLAFKACGEGIQMRNLLRLRMEMIQESGSYGFTSPKRVSTQGGGRPTPADS